MDSQDINIERVCARERGNQLKLVQILQRGALSSGCNILTMPFQELMFYLADDDANSIRLMMPI